MSIGWNLYYPAALCEVNPAAKSATCKVQPLIPHDMPPPSVPGVPALQGAHAPSQFTPVGPESLRYAPGGLSSFLMIGKDDSPVLLPPPANGVEVHQPGLPPPSSANLNELGGPTTQAGIPAFAVGVAVVLFALWAAK